MQIKFAKINSDPLILDKRGTFNNASPINLDVQLYDGCSLDNPVFILSIDYINRFNFCFVPKWGKYYYLGDGDILDGSRCAIPGTCDVLTTYADEIKDLNCLIVRQETRQSGAVNVVDNKMIRKTNTTTNNIVFTQSPFSANPSGHCYMLTVLGGAATQQGGAEND